MTDDVALPEELVNPVVREPRRWLGPRGGWWLLLIGGGILAIYLGYDALIAPHTTSYRSLPVMSIELGSILAAVCVFYTMLYRVRPGDDVTIARLFAALGLAAFGTTFAASQVEGLLERWLSGTGQPTLSLTLFAGPVEETLKGLTVLLIGIGVRTKTLRGGLFLGGAVGLGFAAVENLSYLVTTWEHPSTQFGQLGGLTVLIAVRTVITPLLHPIFTALVGGMLFAASSNGRYRLSVPFVGTFFAVLGVHSLWDSVGPAVDTLRDRLSSGAISALGVLVIVIEGAIAIGMPFIWRAVARHAAVLAGIRPPKAARTTPASSEPPTTP